MSVNHSYLQHGKPEKLDRQFGKLWKSIREANRSFVAKLLSTGVCRFPPKDDFLTRVCHIQL